jgi:hypothetical protein
MVGIAVAGIPEAWQRIGMAVTESATSVGNRPGLGRSRGRPHRTAAYRDRDRSLEAAAKGQAEPRPCGPCGLSPKPNLTGNRSCCQSHDHYSEFHAHRTYPNLSCCKSTLNLNTNPSNTQRTISLYNLKELRVVSFFLLWIRRFQL